MRLRMAAFWSERAASLISFSRPSNSSPSGVEGLGDGGVGGGVALGLVGDGAGLGEVGAGERLDLGLDVVLVVEHRRELERRDAAAGLDLLDELVLEVDRLPDPHLAGLEPVGDHLFGDLRGAGLVVVPRLLGAAGLDHHDGDVVTDAAAGDDQLEGALLDLLEGGVRDPGALGAVGDAHGADGAVERDARDRQRRGGAVDGEHVVGVLPVGAHDRDDDLGLVAEAVGEGRAQRPVDQAAGEDGGVGGTALPAEEAAGDAPGGVHPLLDVDREREEVDALAHALGGVGGDQCFGAADLGDHGSLALEGQLARLEREGLVGAADGPRDDDGVSHVCSFLDGPGTPPAGSEAAGPVPSWRPPERATRPGIGNWQLTGPPPVVVCVTAAGRSWR